MCHAVSKGTLRRKNKNKFCIACFGGHSTGNFEANIRSLAQFSAELLQIL